MYAALGVGNQMIAVLPESDIVIVNRANTYEGERTPGPALLDLIEQILDARTGTPVADPALQPLDVGSDPHVTGVPADRLAEFEGAWDYPAPLLGFPAVTTVEITTEEDHLVAYSPLAGTFKLYLQEDGQLHEEDSHRRYILVRDGAGSLAGVADGRTVVSAAVIAAADGERDRAAELLALVEDDENLEFEVARAMVDLLAGREEAAERAVRHLAERGDPSQVEANVNGLGYVLLQAEKTERALEVLELNTRVFPDAFNTWDSLGEAHMMLGHDDEAIRAYERSLDLNPENTNAEAMIAQIKEQS
jgi:tetratricopeptide (TPR) repeat protein